MIKIMTANIIGQLDIRISDITLAFFEGTGFYTINYTWAEPSTWGYLKGCNFVYGACETSSAANFDEFCVASQYNGWTCSLNRQFVSQCIPGSQDAYSNGCLYGRAVDGYNCSNTGLSSWSGVNSEVFGGSSACFEGNLRKAGTTPTNQQGAFCFTYTVDSYYFLCL